MKTSRDRQTEYVYREYIAEIETSELFTIVVDDRSNRIASVSGTLHIDRDLPRVPNQSEQEAIEVVLRHIRENENVESYNLSGDHAGQIVYRKWGESIELTPFWRIDIELTGPIESQFTHRSFLVDPDNGVTMEGATQGQ